MILELFFIFRVYIWFLFFKSCIISKNYSFEDLNFSIYYASKIFVSCSVPNILSKIYFHFHTDNWNYLHISLTFVVLLTPV